MITLAYTITREIRQTLDTNEQVRRSILTTPLQPHIERKLVWNAWIERLEYAAKTESTSISRRDIVKLTSGDRRLRQTAAATRLLTYQEMLRTLHEQWFGRGERISLKHIEEIASLLNTRIQTPGGFSVEDKRIIHLLTYASSQAEDPIVTMSIVISQWMYLTERQSPDYLTLMIGYLFLFNHGYDTRYLLVLERILLHDSEEFERAFTSIQETNTSNTWISFMATAIGGELARIREHLKGEQKSIGVAETFFHLTKREQRIISYLDTHESITNKRLQRTFNVSQVTASRDLARLSRLGLLLTHGKGRSVFYTKA